MAGGRPTKRTPQVEQRILHALRNGYSPYAAAGYAGVSYNQVKEWRQRFLSFRTECELAEQEAAQRVEGVIINAVANDREVDTALKWLRVRRREDWAEVTRSEQAITGKVVIEHRDQDEEGILAAADEIRERRRRLDALTRQPDAILPVDVS